MLAGKKCNPGVLIAGVVIILGMLIYFAVKHGPFQAPQAPPVHTAQ